MLYFTRITNKSSEGAPLMKGCTSAYYRAGAIRSRRDAVQSLLCDLLASLLREAITMRQSVVGRTFYLLSGHHIARSIENMDPRIMIEITTIKHINNIIVPNPRHAEKL